MRRKLVGIMAAASIFACSLWIFGLGLALYDYFGKPITGIAKPTASTELAKTEVETENPEGFNVLALGDSLTRGTGDSKGKGYVGYLVDSLQERLEQNIIINNLGVNGLTSSELVDMLKQTEIQRQVKNAHIILITIGGNDLFRKGQALIDFNVSNIKEIETAYLKNLDLIFSDLRSLNPKANVFLVGLYNPFSQLGDGETTSQVVRAWNNQTTELIAKYQNIVFVPTYDLFQLQPEALLYTDQFHPNSEGYQLIAERIVVLVSR